MEVVTAHLHFNSHAHVERDLMADPMTMSRLNFNSHAHVERDSPDDFDIIIVDDFNSHAHVERDLGNFSGACSQGKFQLTRSRGA